MKYIVFSDIHGSLYYMKKMQEIILKEKANKIILLGDLYYHGPRNPLPKDYNPMEVAKILNEFSKQIYWIKGNCDAEVDHMISLFKVHNQLTLTLNKKKVLFTHGHKYNHLNIKKNIDIMIYGHFHTGYIKKVDNCICINAGSISLPKENTVNSYLIIDEKAIYLKDLNGKIIASTTLL